MTHLLATLADANHLDQAKQLFSSVYFNAGWKGDYMLLTYDTPEEKLGWFREKGILVRQCKPPDISKLFESQKYDSDLENNLSEDQKAFVTRFRGLRIVLGKFELFSTEFKKWDTVVYLDIDIIVRYSLDGLLSLKGFYAAPDHDNLSLRNQFFLHLPKPQGPLYEELKKNFDLNVSSFNTGVMVISTDILAEDSFDHLLSIFLKYYNSSTYGEQPILNLFLYKKWKKLNPFYNVFVNSLIDRYHIPYYKIDGVALHIFSSNKPWLPTHPFYPEWKASFEKSDRIDLQHRLNAPQFFGAGLRVKYSLYFFYKKTVSICYNFFDKKIGMFGLFLNKHYPATYRGLRKILKKHD